MGQRLNKHLSQEDTQMANKHMERFSASLIIREMQIKSKIRDSIVPSKMAIIQRWTERSVRNDKEKLASLFTTGV